MSKTRKNALLVLFFLFILPAFVLLDQFGGVSIRRIVQASLYDHQDWKKYHGKRFVITGVIDGDTIDLSVPDNDSPSTRIRLLGVDTPETKNPQTGVMYFGPEAYEFSKTLCEGQTVTILLDAAADQRDKYGRLLARVVLPDGTILNERLVRGGYAYADLRFDHSNYDRYLDLQEEAIETKSGLWAGIKRDQFPAWLRQKRPELMHQGKINTQ